MNNTYQEPRQAAHIDGGFGIVPVWVMEADISSKARLVYMALASYAGAGGQAWPTVALIMRRSGLSRATVKRGLNELEDAGIIRRERQYTQAGIETSNLYWIRMQAPPHQAARPDVPVPDGHGGEVYMAAELAGSQIKPAGSQIKPAGSPPEPQNIPRNIPRNINPISPLGDGFAVIEADAAPADAVADFSVDSDVVSEGDKPSPDVASTAGSNSLTPQTPQAPIEQEFEKFWEAFPRERRTAKRQCKQKFTKAVKDGTPPSEIIDAARRYAADPNRVPTYTVAPLVWLNQGRWEDGPLPPRSGAPAPSSFGNLDHLTDEDWQKIGNFLWAPTDPCDVEDYARGLR